MEAALEELGPVRPAPVEFETAESELVESALAESGLGKLVLGELDFELFELEVVHSVPGFGVVLVAGLAAAFVVEAVFASVSPSSFAGIMLVALDSFVAFELLFGHLLELHYAEHMQFDVAVTEAGLPGQPAPVE